MTKRIKSLITVIFIFSLITLQSVFGQADLLTLKELCELSNEIVVAKVSSIEYHNDHNTGRITTIIEYDIIEHIKESSLIGRSKFQMIYPGGKYGEVIQLVSDAPTFYEDETSILFLDERLKNLFSVYATVQGKFNIVQDEIPSVGYVVRDSEYQFIQVSPSQLTNQLIFDEQSKISTTEFIELIKNIL